MTKKILISSLIALLLSIVLLGFLYLQKQKEYEGVDPLSAIPVNSEIIIQFDSFKKLSSKLNENSGAWKELRNFPYVDQINKNINAIEKLVDEIDSEVSISLDRPFTIASHLQGKDKIAFLFVFPLNDYLEQNDLQNALEIWAGPDAQKNNREYHNTTLYQIPMNSNNLKEIYYAFSKGFLLLSPSRLLVENSILQASTNNSISKLKGFSQIKRTIGKNVDANLFLNLKTFPKPLSFHLSKSSAKFVRSFTNFANWAELDVSLRNNILLLNGFTYTDPQESNLMNLFLQQEAVEMEMENILPASTGLFSILGMNKPNLHREKYRKYLDQTSKLIKYQKQLNVYNKNLSLDLENIFYSIIFKELGFAISEGTSKNKFTIIKTKSASIAKDRVLKIVDAYAKKQKRTRSFYEKSYQLDPQTKFQIFKLPIPNIPELLWGEFFKEASSQYFTFIDNYMLMGPNVKALSEFIKEVALGKTMNTNQTYQDNKEFLASQSNFLLYASTPKVNPYLTQFLNKSLQGKFKEYKENINKFQSFGIQLTANKKLIYNNIFIEYDPILELPPQTEWESRLDTCFTHKPYLVKNHYTKEKEIFIQDVNNKIYLINPSGRILWSKQLDEAILGKVHQIDFFRNNKLQYLFVTKKQLHLIDRKGNNVKNYPVRLHSEATNGVSIFDYDKNRNYRFFIPCADKKIYAYNKNGKTLKGWKPAKAENKITCKPQHFRISNKDYIVYADEYRIYILNRKGKERVKLQNQFAKSVRNPFYQYGNSIITTDQSGVIRRIYFNGKSKNIELGTFSNQHFFTISNLTGDSKLEYLFADKNQMKVFNSEGKEIFTKEYNSNISNCPSIYRFSKWKTEIGFCLKDDNQIHLIDAKGNNHKGFPVKGSTEFSIGFSKNKKKSFNLYVGDRKNFLLNYSVL